MGSFNEVRTQYQFSSKISLYYIHIYTNSFACKANTKLKYKGAVNYSIKLLLNTISYTYSEK